MPSTSTRRTASPPTCPSAAGIDGTIYHRPPLPAIRRADRLAARLAPWRWEKRIPRHGGVPVFPSLLLTVLVTAQPAPPAQPAPEAPAAETYLLMDLLHQT